jgi:hypothetical protein
MTPLPRKSAAPPTYNFKLAPGAMISLALPVIEKFPET